MKTLRVCLSQELPDILDRDPEYIYFCFDKLTLFLGQNPYYEPFVICESVPDTPITGCLYILFDGSVKAYINYSIVDVAEIEDSSQAEHLSEIGSTYFVMADKRYLDIQRRTLQLPYNNGTYNLTVSMANDILINENCAILYDGEAQRFYMQGEHTIKPIRWYPWVGSETNSVLTDVETHCIHTYVKLADYDDNLIKVTKGGLYASVSDKVDMSDYQTMLEEYIKYKDQTDTLIAAIETILQEKEALVNEDTIMAMILEALKDYDEGITTIVEFYNMAGKQLEKVESESYQYTDEVFENAQAYLEEYLATAFQPWGTYGSTT